MSDSPIKFVQVRCPNCNAVMNLEDYRTTAFCSYCGTRLLIHRQNEQIVHTIDEAKIEQAKAERDIKVTEATAAKDVEMKKLDIKRAKVNNLPKAGKYAVIGCGMVLAFYLLVMIIVGIGGCVANFMW